MASAFKTRGGDDQGGTQVSHRPEIVAPARSCEVAHRTGCRERGRNVTPPGRHALGIELAPGVSPDRYSPLLTPGVAAFEVFPRGRF